jgi:hypothetical protein
MYTAAVLIDGQRNLLQIALSELSDVEKEGSEQLNQNLKKSEDCYGK